METVHLAFHFFWRLGSQYPWGSRRGEFNIIYEANYFSKKLIIFLVLSDYACIQIGKGNYLSFMN